MEIKQATISIGVTVNIGNYESIRIDVALTADMTQEEYDDEGMWQLETEVRKEVAYRLWEYAQPQLETMRLSDMNAEVREGRAQRRSPEFAWMLKLHPNAARDLLADVVEAENPEKAAVEALEAQKEGEDKPPGDAVQEIIEQAEVRE